ncbi:MAG: tetratricopeptide repeat protein [Candidatus Sericytochromatia bacterium]
MKKIIPLTIVTSLILSLSLGNSAFSAEKKEEGKKTEDKKDEKKHGGGHSDVKEVKTNVETKYPVKIPTFEGRHWAEGNNFYDKGMYKEAYHEYFMATRLNPSFWQGFKGLGDVYLKQNSVTKAINNYLKAIEIINPTYAQKTVDEGQVALKEGDYFIAVAKFKKVLDIDPDAGALVNEAVALLKDSKKSQAEKKLQEAVKIDSSTNQYDRKTLTYADAHYKLGFFLYEKKKYEDAQKELEIAVKIEPNEFAYNYALGNSYYKLAFKNKKKVEMPLLKKAISSYDKAIALNPRDPELMYNLAVSKLSYASTFKKTVWEKEEEIFKEVEGDPKAKKAKPKAKDKKKEEPKEKFDLAKKFEKDKKVYKLSQEATNTDNMAISISREALKLLEKVTALNPLDSKAFSYLGDAYSMVGGSPFNYISSAKSYQKAINLDSNLSDLYSKMGTAYYLASKLNPETSELPITRENQKLYLKFGKQFYRAEMLQSSSDSFNSFLRYASKPAKVPVVRNYLATVNNEIANLGFRIPDKNTGR